MKDIIKSFVDSGFPKYGICIFGMILIYNLSLSCIDKDDEMIDQD